MNCYNGEQFIKKSIKSVIKQNYKNWEIIFWDNQSNDKSKKIFKSFKDKRLKYFYSRKHTNLSTARNLAIRHAKGKFIAFLDVDDWWEKNKLNKQILRFDTKKVGLVYSNYKIYDKRDKLKIKLAYTKKLPHGALLKELLNHYCIGLSTIMIKNKYLKKHKLKFNEKYNCIGDFDLVMKISKLFSINCCQESLANYTLHKNNDHIVKFKLYIKEINNWVKINKNLNKIYPKEFSKINDLANYLDCKELLNNEQYKKSIFKFTKINSKMLKLKIIFFYFFKKIQN